MIRVSAARYFTLIFSCFVSTVAYCATVYQWTDSSGVVHYTDNSDKIPERYLSGAREIASEPASAQKTMSAETTATAADPPAAPTATQEGPRAKLAHELEALKDGLPAKKKELARLYHKWMVAKGRTPTEKELKEFEEKRAKGEATYEDNPYVNKKPLSNPAPARVAYYRKLEEVKKDEARIEQLERELGRK